MLLAGIDTVRGHTVWRAVFTISGDMALRISWGNDPQFLISIGGYRPLESYIGREIAIFLTFALEGTALFLLIQHTGRLDYAGIFAAAPQRGGRGSPSSSCRCWQSRGRCPMTGCSIPNTSESRAVAPAHCRSS